MAKSIMIQGTMSGAGKSILVTALCRIFRQDGFHAAPFKSQNMALNSYITPDGLEIGRAQAVQAEAAGVPCSADMNPILLKPTSETGSQVIVHGSPIGVMSARDYFSFRTRLIPEISRSFRNLSEETDIVVIEGAGSPAEINLNQNDIVNMGLAKLTGSPVLLVGDIDRGGVFAQLYGTVMLISETERRYIRGLIINRFRGDKSLLDPGIRDIEKLTGIPVLGTIPWVDVDIDDEDSLSTRLDRRKISGGAFADIAVIRFPRISNFTDFHALEAAGAGVRYVSHEADLGNPDAVILPGTKNTIDDLLWLRSSGLEGRILRYAASGKPVLGICGGYQMLGKSLEDPEGSESGTPGKALRGLGLLPSRTVFSSEKRRTRCRGRIRDLPGIFAPLSGHDAEGYEVHTGKTTVEDTAGPVADLAFAGSAGGTGTDGAVLGNVFGTYVHGFFDAPGMADAFLRVLGKESRGTVDYRAYREEQYDRLADAVRGSLRMEQVYAILERGMD